ncbi:menin-like [Mercenaria mercenaria]|uniref:menin-like n=1 Tax=Mercenaria mercenaria TaxID=6596 RepID=UPI00234F3912|nr:menin-like [Mercenaria mercenaria]
MAGFNTAKQHFPLQKIQDVLGLFKDQLTRADEIDLSLLSIVLGTIENALTVNRSHALNRENDSKLQPIFPIIEWETIDVLRTKFVTQIKSAVDLSLYPDKFASRELVKKVSDVIWGGLTRAFYKDRAHLQSLFSFLTGNKLDCFGVAFAVVAAFQVLGYNDVHLALSEDHAWVIFGENQDQSAEVTWHGKGNEDKRGQPINQAVSEKHWLYLNGQPVVCTKEMEVAAIVSAINPSITATIDSVEMGSVQQELLWLLYDMGHLSKYPMSLGNLGDLEEICESPGRPPPLSLFEEGVKSSVTNYNDQHIYPYTYLGGHLYRMGKYREALQAWACASNVIKQYNYNREDEEIYKEFIEIANDWLPTIMRNIATENAARLRRNSLLYDTDAYANFLKFYDGICKWEEDSPTPVLHTVWAKQFVYSLGKFDSRVRKCIQIHAEGVEDESSSSDSSSEDENQENCDVNGNGVVKEDGVKKSRGRKPKAKKRKLNEQKLGNGVQDGSGDTKVNGNNAEEQIKHTIEELVSKVGESDSQRDTPPNPNLAALAQACSESILNPDYLLTGGEPFTTATTRSTPSSTSDRVNVDVNEFLSSKSNSTQFVGMTVDSMLKAESPADMMMFRKPPDSAPSSEEVQTPTPEPTEANTNLEVDAITSGCETSGEEKLNNSFAIVTPDPVDLLLVSQKMKGLRKLLSSLKLNSSAITLQLTAQSQTDFKHSRRGTGEFELIHSRKRSRRDIL